MMIKPNTHYTQYTVICTHTDLYTTKKPKSLAYHLILSTRNPAYHKPCEVGMAVRDRTKPKITQHKEIIFQ